MVVSITEASKRMAKSFILRHRDVYDTPAWKSAATIGSHNSGLDNKGVSEFQSTAKLTLTTAVMSFSIVVVS